MVQGYLIGCFLSVVLWRINRQEILSMVNKLLIEKCRNKWLVFILYSVVSILIIFGFSKIPYSGVNNFITALIVIDIGNMEYRSLLNREKVNFHGSISPLSATMIGGFIAPLFYILLWGNIAGVFCYFVYLLSCEEEWAFFKWIRNILFIVPCILIQPFLFGAYIYIHRNYRIDFKREYLKNLILNPLLNLDIFIAHIELIHFYQYEQGKKSNTIMKSYGPYNKGVDKTKVKHYIGIQYGIYSIFIILFIVIIHYIKA